MGSADPKFNPAQIVSRAISHYDNYCDGYTGNSGGSYLLGLVLGVATAPLKLGHDGSRVLDEINAFDKAEVEETNLGQINMITVSSFCGPQGLLWGYDLVTSSDLRTPHPLIKDQFHQNSQTVPVYDAKPLVEATRCLFGTLEERRFPLLPGAHVPCAGRNKKDIGPKHLYTAVGIGIPKERASAACLLMEDVGWLPNTEENHSFDFYRRIVLNHVAQSIIEIGSNQQVEYQEIFVTMKDIVAQHGEMGCALVAAPYFTLAKNALPKGQPEKLIQITLSEWEQEAQDKLLSLN